MKEPKKPFLTQVEIDLKNKNRTYTQRFELLMKLIRIDKMLRKAKIVYPQTNT